MTHKIALLFFLCLTITQLSFAQEGFNTPDRIALEHCGFKEDNAARYNCYSKILNRLFHKDLEAYLKHTDLQPNTEYKTQVKILLDVFGKFQLQEVKASNEYLEKIVEITLSKLEWVLPLIDENGNKIPSEFSMLLTSYVNEEGEVVAGIKKQEVGGFEDLTPDLDIEVIENVPVYPGCEGDSNEALKKCMSQKVQTLIGEQFNTNLVNTLNLPAGIQRIYAKFTISNEGKVGKIKVRASHPQLAEEAKRVISLIPEMTPGYQRGEAVGVMYAIPIIFKVEESAKEKRKRLKRERKNRKKQKD